MILLALLLAQLAPSNLRATVPTRVEFRAEANVLHISGAVSCTFRPDPAARGLYYATWYQGVLTIWASDARTLTASPCIVRPFERDSFGGGVIPQVDEWLWEGRKGEPTPEHELAGRSLVRVAVPRGVD